MLKRKLSDTENEKNKIIKRKVAFSLNVDEILVVFECLFNDLEDCINFSMTNKKIRDVFKRTPYFKFFECLHSIKPNTFSNKYIFYEYMESKITKKKWENNGVELKSKIIKKFEYPFKIYEDVFKKILNQTAFSHGQDYNKEMTHTRKLYFSIDNVDELFYIKLGRYHAYKPILSFKSYDRGKRNTHVWLYVYPEEQEMTIYNESFRYLKKKIESLSEISNYYIIKYFCLLIEKSFDIDLHLNIDNLKIEEINGSSVC